jgi:hypothetical protein
MNIYLSVEAILSDEEKAQFLRAIHRSTRGFDGAGVADVIDIFEDHDMHLNITEPLYEEHEAEIDAYQMPMLFRLCCYLALYLHDGAGPQLWEQTKGYMDRWVEWREAKAPWTVTLEITITASDAAEAEAEGQKMVGFIISGWDGAAGSVVKTDLNTL